MTQTAGTDADRATAQGKQAKRRPAQAQPQAPSAAAMNANAQAGTAAVQSLDTITVAASKTEEKAIDALAPVSVVTLEQIQGLQPNRLSDIFYNIPGVTFQERGDDPSTVINIRGLQDFGRVAVVVDGARQNYQRTGHNANGAFFLDPELIGGSDRLDTQLMQAASGRIISKVGADGVWLCGVLPCEKYPTGLGIALKVADGDDYRARPVLAVEILRRLGVLNAGDLAEISPMRIKSRRGDIVGRVEATTAIEELATGD